MCECGLRYLVERRLQLLDTTVCEAAQILEAIREDGLAAPRFELSGNALGRMPAQQIAVPHAEAVEFRAVRGVQRRQLAIQVVRVEQSGLELAYRREQCISEPAEAGRTAETVERLTGECAADDEGPLRLGRNGTRLAATAREPLEEIVERADRPAEDGGLDSKQVALHPLDVRPVRHDQVRLPRQHLEIPVKQERNLPGVGRAGDEVQTQLTYSSRAFRRRPSRQTLGAGKLRRRLGGAA